MARRLGEIMTANPVTLDGTASVLDAARTMRDRGIGDVIVRSDQKLCGIVTDRDLVVRAIASGQEPAKTRLGSICSEEISTLTPEDTDEDAMRLMKEKAIRRIPVVEGGKVVGIVSLGDLALERDPNSVLAAVSASPSNT